MAYGKGRRKGISKTTVEEAIRAAKEGRPYEVRDSEVGGLSIRVRKTSASWALRFRIKGEKGQSTLTIARVDLLRDVARAREIALRGKALAAGGESPAAYFRACLASEDDTEAEAKVRRAAGSEWTWDEAVVQFLEAMREAEYRPNTIEDYGQALRNPAVRSRLSGRLLSTITDEDVRGVRNAIRKTGHRRQMAHCLGRIQQLLEWACDEEGSGIRRNPAASVGMGALTGGGRPSLEDAVEHAGSQESPKRFLDEREAGLFLWEAATLDRIFELALTLELFTAQRRATVVRAIKKSFVEDPNWGLVWVVHPGILKRGEKEGQRPHALPLPEKAAEAARLAISMSREDSPFLFPKFRPRRATDSRDGTMSLGVLNRKLRKIQEPGKPLHSQRPWSTHSFRYSFTTYCGRLGIGDEDRDLVMHHNEGAAKSMADMEYQQDPKLGNKQEALRRWHDFVMEMKAKHAPSDAPKAAAE